MNVFIFDLDGTITTKETLPVIAEHFAITKKIEELTRETVSGSIPFIESFIHRVHVLGKFPVTEVASLLATIPLYPQLVHFIQTYKKQCLIATNNLSCWVSTLIENIGCRYYSSSAEVLENNTIKKISTILKKEEIILQYKSMGHTTIFIGDGNNDMEAMRYADIAIASGSGLIINKIYKDVKHITAIELFKEFSQHIVKSPNITILNENIFEFTSTQKYDVITCFGIMHYVNKEEAKTLYKKIKTYIKKGGVLIVKNQFGIDDEITIDGFSEKLQKDYYAQYRHLPKEIELLKSLGFTHVESFDIYPPEANKFSNTHFYDIVAGA